MATESESEDPVVMGRYLNDLVKQFLEEFCVGRTELRGEFRESAERRLASLGVYELIGMCCLVTYCRESGKKDDPKLVGYQRIVYPEPQIVASSSAA